MSRIAIIAIIAMQMSVIAIHMSIIAMPTQSPTPNPSNSPSPSAVPALEKKAADLDSKAEFWTRFSFWFVVATAIAVSASALAAVGYGIGQKFLGIRARQAAAAHAEVSAQKDRENSAAIEAVKANAAAADERAGKANEAAGIANAEAGRANERARALELEATNLKKQNLATETNLEKERATRRELEQSIAPRSLPTVIISGVAAGDPLKPFGQGITFQIQTVSDGEARRAAGHIAMVLLNAGFKVEPLIINMDLNVNDGVSIVYRRGFEGEHPDSVERAAVAVTAFLLAYDWIDVYMKAVPPEERRQAILPLEMRVPANTIAILVGFNPNPYFRDPTWHESPMYSYNTNLLEVRRLTEEMKQSRARMNDTLEKLKPEFLKRDEMMDKDFEDAMRRYEEDRRRSEQMRKDLEKYLQQKPPQK